MLNFSKICFVLFFSILMACQQEELDLNSDRTFTFGQYFESCNSIQCIDIWHIEYDQVLINTSLDIPERDEFFIGDFIAVQNPPLTPNAFVFDIPVNPENLDQSLYAPEDFTSQDTLIYFEYFDEGISQFWKIDKHDTTSIPSELLNLRAEVIEYISILK